jgi:hypothetical protein
MYLSKKKYQKVIKKIADRFADAKDTEKSKYIMRMLA